MTEHPHITIALDPDRGYVLMATSYGMTEPAGPRLFKAPPHPEIKFVHETAEAALRDAATLEAYIVEQWPQGKQSKTAMRKNKESRA